jgi:SH3 domain-containing YSC84-like protein 1
MKVLFVFLLLVGLVLPARATDTRADLDERIRKLGIDLDVMQAKPDRRIPPETLRSAQGVVLLDRVKAGFLFAYEGGSGVAMVRDPKTSRWSAPAFFRASEASLGLQGGGQQSLVVVLLMNTNANRMLTERNYDVGGEASGTAGSASGAAEGSLNSDRYTILVYTDRAGLFGGAAFKGSSLSPDNNAILTYYGQALTVEEVLFGHKAKPSNVAADLIKKLDQYSK